MGVSKAEPGLIGLSQAESDHVIKVPKRQSLLGLYNTLIGLLSVSGFVIKAKTRYRL